MNWAQEMAALRHQLVEIVKGLEAAKKIGAAAMQAEERLQRLQEIVDPLVEAVARLEQRVDELQRRISPQ